MCKGCCSKGGCTLAMVGKVLLIVGGINWGLVGLGMLLGSVREWNVVYMLLGGMPIIEGIVYVLVGVAAVMKIFGCQCGKCKDGVCGPSMGGEASKPEGNM